MSALAAQVVIASSLLSTAIVWVCRMLRERQALAVWERSKGPDADAGQDIKEIIASFHQARLPRRRRRRPC